MRLARKIVPLAALVLALSAPPVAGARTRDSADRPLRAPTHQVDGIDANEAMGLVWARAYTLPPDANPASCERLGRHGAILLPRSSEDAPCRVDSNTTILVTDIPAWMKSWNDNPRPYVWTKTAEQILDSIRRYCERINDSRR